MFNGKNDLPRATQSRRIYINERQEMEREKYMGI
jgi:hypothetical protein